MGNPFLNRWVLGAIGAAVLLLAGMMTYHRIYQKGYDAGYAAAVAEQKEAQAKHEKKVKTEFKRIKREAPADDNDTGVADFLLKHTTAR